jgi:hypothetical protein
MISITVEDRELPLFLNRGEIRWLIGWRFIADHELPLGRLAAASLLLKTSASELIGPPAELSGLDPVFDEPEPFTVDSFPEREISILENSETNPGAVVELFQGKLENRESCDSDGYLRLLRKMALGRGLPPDFVRQFAVMLTSGGSLRERGSESILFLGTAFRHYPEQIIDVLESEKVIERESEVFDGLEAKVQEAFVRLLLNYACYSVDAPARLSGIAGALAGLSLKSLTALDSGDFVKVCHICVKCSPEAAEKLKPQIETIRQLKPTADSIRELLADLTTKLCQ